MYCKNCGNLIDETATYCNVCSTAIDQQGYRVVIEEAASHNLDAIRMVIEITKCSPARAKEILSIPPIVFNADSAEDADFLKERLISSGVQAYVSSPPVYNFSPDRATSKVASPPSPPKTKITYEETYDSPPVTEKLQSGCSQFVSGVKKVITVIEIIIAVVIAYLFFTGKLSTAFNDLIAFISKDENPYIVMVQSMCPFENGRTYYEAFSQEFDSNEWSYFKSGDKRIVQVISSYNDMDDELITQFLLTPTEGDGEYWIEPYAMRSADQNLSSLEINLVIAAIFEGELINAFGDLLLGIY